MKKTFLKASLFVATMTLSLGFASCSDDDDPVTEGNVVPATELSAVANTYVNDIINPTYKDLRDNAKLLKDACDKAYANAKAGNLSDADITSACEAFKNARREWERSEAFLYGAAANNEIDPHIDSWPLDHDKMVEALNNQSIISGIKGSNPAQFIYTKQQHFESVIGFHGLEFVLFRNGAERTAAMLNANETEAGMTSVKGIDELAFAAAVAGDIYNMTSLLQYGWNGDATLGSWLTSNCNWVVDGLKGLENSAGALSSAGIGYGQFLLNATGDKAWFPTWQETLENVFVGGCSNICQEVYTQKLGQAYRVATGHGGTTEDGKKESRDYIESPYSKRSFIDYQDNIYSIKNSLYGTRDVTATTPVANSLMTIMKKYNYSGYNTLSTALDEAIAALESAKKSGIAFVDDPAHAQVKTCIDKINTLDDELNKAGAWFRALKVSK